MFTGIIEHLGTISRLDLTFAGGTVYRAGSHADEASAVSASVAVNGCCLTVVHRDGNHFFSPNFPAKRWPRLRSGRLKVGARVTSNRPSLRERVRRHFVLGHVDTTGRVVHLKSEGGAGFTELKFPEELARYVVSKGSITIDGISLTGALAKSHR